MDGWRGSRLGYAGGRTGYMANYGNNDALRGTLGANQVWSSAAYNSSARNQQVAQSVITGLAVTGILFFAAPQLRSVGKDLKKRAQRAAQQIRPN
jgi:hypothetical protein